MNFRHSVAHPWPRYFNFWFEYCRLRRPRTIPCDARPTLLLDVCDDRFNRYLYLLVKFFLIQGWDLRVKHHFAYLSSGDPYSLSWLRSGTARVVLRQPRSVRLVLRAGSRSGKERDVAELSADYFGLDPAATCWSVPMAMHPMQYESDWTRQYPEFHDGRRGIIFAGNADIKLYANMSLSEHFGIPPRKLSLDHLRGSLSVRLWEDWTDAHLHKKSLSSDKLVLCDRTCSEIPGPSLRRTMAHFAFALALPGWAVPHCHNAIEALSVGCIPIIHDTYAKLLHPRLEDGVNCLTYKDLDELTQAVDRALAMNIGDVRRLSKNASELYEKHFIPSSVVNGVLKACSEGKSIKLFAELESLRLFLERPR
jgi:hypothetical protein